MATTDTLLYRGEYIQLVKRKGWELIERIKGHDVVTICPLTADGEVVFVEQYRAPHSAQCIEWPAGLVGDHGTPEIIEDAARRELEEETGYTSDWLAYVGQFAISCGLTNEAPHFFVAPHSTRMGTGGGVESERITVHTVPLREAFSWLMERRADGHVVSANTFAGLLFLEWYLNGCPLDAEYRKD